MWELVFLGVMAAALVGMAVAQMILAREATKMCGKRPTHFRSFAGRSADRRHARARDR